MICNWAHVAGQRWQDRLARWFDGSGCDVWVMRKETREPSDYALFWNRERAKIRGFTEIYDNWMSYYERERIEAISTGLITMRRTSRRSNWLRADDVPEKSFGSIGDDIARGFETYDWLETMRDDRALLDARLKVGPDIRFEQQLQAGEQGWQIVGGQLRRTKGLAYSGDVDPDTADLFIKCDGKRRIGELIADLAARRNVDPESIIPAYVAVVRRLVSRGFLLPIPSNDEGPKQFHGSITDETHEQLVISSLV